MYIRHSKSLLYTARGQVVGSQPAVVTQCRLRIWIFFFHAKMSDLIKDVTFIYKKDCNSPAACWKDWL